MTAGMDPSPMVALIELRAHISAGAAIAPSDAARLTEVVRGSFEAWSDAAEDANELTILIMRGVLEPWQQTYALELLNALERAFRRGATIG